MLERLRSKRVLAVLAVVVGVAAVAAYVAYDRLLERPGDVSNPDVEFVEPTPTPAEEEEGKAPRRRPRPFTWARYGFTKSHERNFQPGYTLKGPWKQRWRVRAPQLTEFPPVLHDNVLYLVAGNGLIKAFTADRGKVLWKRRLGALSASSPALDGRRVYVSLLQGRAGRNRGRVVALRPRDGKLLWSRRLSARTESSPLVHKGRVYFGAEDGTLYAVRAATGRTIWTYRARGAIKGSPTLASNGNLYFGDYGGYVHAVRAGSGRGVWAQPVAARSFRGGRFYATAAVSWGRVFIGSTDGRQYALSARSGALAWARQTGNYVYSSAALASVPGKGPTVFFGSYDGRLYALDAKSGGTRWTYRSGGRVSGSPTVVGNVVYFSDVSKARTYGINIASGKLQFRYPHGGYDPVISDGRHLFLTGRRSVTAWLASNAPPVRKVRQPAGTGVPRAQNRRAQKRRAAERRRKERASERRRKERAADRRRAALRRCAKRDTRRAQARCKARIRRQ